jgi:putative addiction module killer protein
LDAIQREVLVCQTDDGSEPFTEWFHSLDPKTLAKVAVRIERMEGGNLGDTRSVGLGITELKIDYGPGYRVYFGQIGKQIHLIRGGTKPSQHSDIAKAQEFWRKHA